MNLLAFFKNLTIILFVILYLQYDDDNNISKRLSVIPYSACATVIMCLFLMIIPNSNVFYNNRLQGTFYYANSYGLFLLIGVMVLANKTEISWKEFIKYAILFVGIVITNSRAIIILTFLVLLMSLFINKVNIKKSIILILGFIMLYVGISSFSNMDKRLSSDMLGSSEFVTRLLYYKDALSMIKSNPFGYGYEGWYYKQVEVQTGVYDTKYVHSSILQVALDVGIIPTVAIFVMLLINFFDKRQNAFSRMIMLVILGHSIIDIDLEYMYFVMILVLFINFDRIKLIKNKIQLITIIGLMVGFFTIFLSDVCFASKEYETSIKVLPFHTEAIQELLYSTTSIDEQLKYANIVLKYNKNVSGAYEALSNRLQADKRYMEALEYEKKRLELNKYTMYNYLIYASFLSDGIQYYSTNGEYENVGVLLRETVNIEDKINDVINKTNPLCYKTIHSPQLEIPSDLQLFIDNAKESITMLDHN